MTLIEDDNEPDPIEIIEPVVERASRADRILRDESARQRRKETKEAKSLQSFKEEKEARERLLAKRRMEKLHRQKVKKMQNKA